MSALHALDSPHRIKASHRLRWKCSTGHSVYANNNPYTFVDPDGRQATDRFSDAFARDPRVSSGPEHTLPAVVVTAVMAAPVIAVAGAEITSAARVNPAAATALVGDLTVGDALGGAGVAVAGTALYRVVDDVELESIVRLGKFTASPNGDGVKRFLDNLPDAEALKKKFAEFFGGNQHVVSGQAPQEIMENATRTPFTDVPGRPMDSVNIPSSQAENIICTGIVREGC